MRQRALDPQAAARRHARELVVDVDVAFGGQAQVELHRLRERRGLFLHQLGPHAGEEVGLGARGVELAREEPGEDAQVAAQAILVAAALEHRVAAEARPHSVAELEVHLVRLRLEHDALECGEVAQLDRRARLHAAAAETAAQLAQADGAAAERDVAGEVGQQEARPGRGDAAARDGAAAFELDAIDAVADLEVDGAQAADLEAGQRGGEEAELREVDRADHARLDVVERPRDRGLAFEAHVGAAAGQVQLGQDHPALLDQDARRLQRWSCRCLRRRRGSRPGRSSRRRWRGRSRSPAVSPRRR